jgi:hypothetical protein
VFSGGYADDEWSEDDPWYTGEGGQDVERRCVLPALELLKSISFAGRPPAWGGGC